LWWGLLALPVVFLYLLKLRRRRVVVPSTLLWSRAAAEIEANAPFRRLRRSMLLALQLLILALTVTALARPLLVGEAELAGRTVLVLDASASMQAIEEDGRSRLDQAKVMAAELIGELGPGDEAALVESAAEVVVRQPMTSDLARLKRTIDAIEPTDAPGRLAEALLLAGELARAGRAETVVIITDLAERAAAMPDVGLATRVIKVGATRENMGITAFTARTDPARPGEREVFVSVQNFGTQPSSATVELAIDGALADLRELELQPGQVRGLVFGLDAVSTGLAEARLVHPADALASDDVAYTYLPDSTPLQVAISSDNVFVSRALQVLPGVQVESASPNPSGADVLVASGRIPDPYRDARCPVLVFEPVTEPDLWTSGEAILQPQVTSWDEGHPVNRSVNWAGMAFDHGVRLQAGGWLRPVAVAGTDGVIWAGIRDGRRFVVVAVALTGGDFTITPDFLVFIAGALDWLRGSGEAAARSVRSGAVLPVSAQGERAFLTRPDGGTDSVLLQAGAGAYTNTSLVGIYRLDAAGTTTTVGVSLLDAVESSLAERTRAAPDEVTGNATAAAANEREIWRWLVLAAVAVLMAEWLVYHRRLSA
jgi:hypothetical protein